MTREEIEKRAYEVVGPLSKGWNHKFTVDFALEIVRRHNVELEKIVRREYWESSNITDIILSIREAKP